MLSADTKATTAPCPKCRAGMILAAITPHPIASDMERHTYLCKTCNQTKTYILPSGNPHAASERTLDVPW